MNAVHEIDHQLRSQGQKPALVFPQEAVVTFADLAQLASRVQTSLLKEGLKPGQCVLLAIELSPLLYASIIACARLGLPMGLVEPWMPLDRIEKAVTLLKPAAFLAGWKGRIWGLRVPAIRRIPHWLSPKHLLSSEAREQSVAAVDPDLPCIITFTSGSTGVPKGVVRSHSYLGRQQTVFSAALQTKDLGPDLVTFANIALENLGHGRCSVLMPSTWPSKAFTAIEQLPRSLQPETMVVGPAFLHKALRDLSLPQLKAFFVGGALSDCALFEAALSRWPSARAVHLYGSTEAEPVAQSPMKLAVLKSREAGHYQVTYCGQPTPGMLFEQSGDQTWISGSHVSPEYLGDETSNAQNKRRDASGILWHRMGDRIKICEQAWWYYGREQQNQTDFIDEQRLYSAIRSSEAMIDRGPSGERIVYCTGAQQHQRAIKALWSDATEVREAIIKRDRRHRARIDRAATRW